MTSNREKTPFRFKVNQPTNWFHKADAKSNQNCLYCSRPLHDGTLKSNKEHLIGRNFVPTGCLDDGKAFNFIFKACIDCNTEKAQLEGHVSSVTLFNSDARSDNTIDALARRKAENDFHPTQKGVRVKDAQLEHKVEMSGEILKTQFNLISPPQLTKKYVQLLAFRHIQGFFSLITSHNPLTSEGIKLLPTNHWWFGDGYMKSDWGNRKIAEMTRRVHDWEPLLSVDTANGFFKAIIRCSPKENGPWFWALEWNKSYRVFGGIFDSKNLPEEFNNLPEPSWTYLTANQRIFQETELNPHEDFLF
jgi:hypothetical protein